MPTFIDMFAGAGGFSEGFLQAEYKDKYYDFLLASDINPTCEVTHRMRYNHQLGLNTEFITKDITAPDFVEELLLTLKNTFNSTEVDVLTGGPPCQSFSLAGERRKNDKKDDLFSYYLKTISILQPKYFIMENVYGILTKDKGRIKDRILKEINNIVDYNALKIFVEEIKEFKLNSYIAKNNQAKYDQLIILLNSFIDKHNQEVENRKLYISLVSDIKKNNYTEAKKRFILDSLLATKNITNNSVIENLCNNLSEQFVSAFRNNKEISEDDRNVIRQALNIVGSSNKIAEIKEKIRQQININHLNRSSYKELFDNMTDDLEIDSLLEIAIKQCDDIISRSTKKSCIDVTSMIKNFFSICTMGVSEIIDEIRNLIISAPEEITSRIDELAADISLYHIENPMRLIASDYGVPQNRQRVVFIGCRKDQPLITEIPHTVTEEEKVTVAEAIGDLDFIGNNEHLTKYSNKSIKNFSKTNYGQQLRTIDGIPANRANSEECHSFAEWSRIGRLNPSRFPKLAEKDPAYTSANSISEYKENELQYFELQNHETSNHSQIIVDRYALMRKYGDYDKAKKAEPNNPLLATNKRDYTCLDADKPSTTVMTIADDFSHYSQNRALTVREMARLQSFDDSFVFQGKRTTGGDRRKFETPQFTQVGNAVPPLMARAIAMEILKNIK